MPRPLIVIAALAAVAAGAWVWAGRPDLDRMKALAGLAPAPQQASATESSRDGKRPGGPSVAVVTADVTSADFPIRRRSIGYAEPWRASSSSRVSTASSSRSMSRTARW
jgi:hypothetical protein